MFNISINRYILLAIIIILLIFTLVLFVSDTRADETDLYFEKYENMSNKIYRPYADPSTDLYSNDNSLNNPNININNTDNDKTYYDIQTQNMTYDNINNNDNDYRE